MQCTGHANSTLLCTKYIQVISIKSSSRHVSCVHTHTVHTYVHIHNPLTGASPADREIWNTQSTYKTVSRVSSSKHPLLQVCRYSNWWLFPPHCHWALRQGFIWATPAASDSSPFGPTLLLLCFPFKPLLPKVQDKADDTYQLVTRSQSSFIAHSSYSYGGSGKVHRQHTHAGTVSVTPSSRTKGTNPEKENKLTYVCTYVVLHVIQNGMLTVSSSKRLYTLKH